MAETKETQDYNSQIEELRANVCRDLTGLLNKLCEKYGSVTFASQQEYDEGWEPLNDDDEDWDDEENVDEEVDEDEESYEDEEYDEDEESEEDEDEDEDEDDDWTAYLNDRCPVLVLDLYDGDMSYYCYLMDVAPGRGRKFNLTLWVWDSDEIMTLEDCSFKSDMFTSTDHLCRLYDEVVMWASDMAEEE